MRVALVSPYALDVAGGVQSHVLSLAVALARAGDEVLVLGPSAAGHLPARTASGVRQLAVGRTVTVPANGSRAPIALGPGVASRVRTILRRAAPDVVHVHEPLVPMVGPAALLATRAPCVLTFHATAEAGPLRTLYRGARVVARPLVDRAAACTAVSPVAAAFHAEMIGIDRADLTIVPNGVEVARFAGSVRTPSRPEEARLVFLGRLEPRKGADVVVRAFLALAAHRAGIRLRVLGDGPLAPVLREMVAEAPAHVAARIELVGRVAPAALPALLADADVALLPARGGESFGIVLLEAMAAGLPIVATDIPGYRAVARHDREALLVPPGDHVALAAAAARILDDVALAERLRAAGAHRAVEHDWSAVAARVREVHRSVVRDTAGEG